ncbi:MAG: hypothetical protein IT340_22535 [Chloroflexi bacterium]|nr:hypothetical protein [Chloroflexota bacterium]
MPDGDVVLVGVPGPYQDILREIRDNQFSDEVLAHDTLRCLRRDLVQYGDEPLRLLMRIHELLAQIPREPLLRLETDWRQLTSRLEELDRLAEGPDVALTLALQASKQHVTRVRRGEADPSSIHALVATYIMEIYQFRFAGRIPGGGIGPQRAEAPIPTRLAAMRTHLESAIETLAARVVRRGSVRGVRLPSRPRSVAPITLDTDLASLGR